MIPLPLIRCSNCSKVFRPRTYRTRACSKQCRRALYSNKYWGVGRVNIIKDTELLFE